MPLLKTTVIPLDNDALAIEQYDHLVQSNKIIMSTLGDSGYIKERLKQANYLSKHTN